MDSKTKIRVETIMEDLVEDGKMFTAYDLTKIIRAEVDQGVKIYHADVRALVNDIWFSDGQVFDDNNYTCSNIQIPIITNGISMFAWIYHHSMTDPKTYDKDALPEDDGSIKSDTNVDTVFPGLVKTDNSIDNILTPDARGRICVPKKALEAIGADPGDEVYVSRYPKNIVIRTNTGDHTYIVDRSHNIRLSAWIFDSDVGFVVSTNVKWKLNGNAIDLYPSV